MILFMSDYMAIELQILELNNFPKIICKANKIIKSEFYKKKSSKGLFSGVKSSILGKV